MKTLSAITVLFTAMAAFESCSDVRRSPGLDYMPDMRYSRAYETYAPHDNLKARGINYTGLPVAGTVKRNEAFPFSLPKDKEGDSTNYILAKQVTNPLPQLDTAQTVETERLYLINCGICHGTNLDGNGPLFNGGNGPYPAAPRNLAGDPYVKNLADGQIFYSVTYGKGSMGAYGSQLTTSQRWKLVHYIRAKQGAGATAPAEGTKVITSGAGNAAGSDSAGAKK